MSILTVALILIFILALFGEAPIKTAAPWVNVCVAVVALVILVISLVH